VQVSSSKVIIGKVINRESISINLFISLLMF
jgi:hypothetical protein